MTLCPKCGANLRIEGDDLVCLTCGHRVIEVKGGNPIKDLARNGNTDDTFEGLVAHARRALVEVQRDLAACEARMAELKSQRGRLEKMLRSLEDKPAGRGAAAGESSSPKCKECGHPYYSAQHKKHKTAAANVL